MNSKNLKMRLLSLIFLAATPLSVYADNNDASADTDAASAKAGANANADKVERVEVTGSHIKRIDVEGVASVQTITHKDLEQKAYSSLSDVVRDLGVSTFGGQAVTGNSTNPGSATIDLHGLGADNTLVLLNGQRLPQDAINGTVDINMIPMAAVERIEILKDGASAIYGSDALGGVVNIITRKDFQGTEISLNQQLSTTYSGGKQTKVSLVNGFNAEKLSVVTSAGFSYTQAINSKDRPWADHNYSLIGNPGSWAPVKDPATGEDGPFTPSANCPPELIGKDGTGKVCKFKYSDYSQESPLLSQFGALSEAHYELNSDIRLTGRINYTHRTAQTIAAPTPGTVRVPHALIPNLGLPADAAPGDIDVRTRLAALGTRNTDVTTNGYGALAGATIQMPKDWTLDLTSNWNLINNRLEGRSGFALKDKTVALIRAGTFNPLAAPGSQGDLTSAKYVPYEDSQSLLISVDAKASGDLAELPAGPLGMAVGTTVSYNSYSDQADPQTLHQPKSNVIGNAGSSGGGHRTFEALFSELSVPVIKKQLELQLAGRFDHFSDFGSTFNPKAGFLFHATPSFLLRGSVGTGFRAPLLTDLYAGSANGNPTFLDHVDCAKNGNCDATQHEVISGGNPNLKEETSISYTLGAIFEPTSDFSFGTDWFYTTIKNRTGIDYEDLTLAEQKGVDPKQYGVIVTRDSDGSINSILAPLQNLSKREELGVDISSSYKIANFRLATTQTQLFFYKDEGFPGAGFTNKLGWNGLPAWRNTSSLTYSIADDQSASLISRSIPHQLTTDKAGFINPLTTFDISYSYKTKVYGEFSIGMINILNSAPPRDPSSSTAPVNYSLYDPNGRQLVLGYKKLL